MAPPIDVIGIVSRYINKIAPFYEKVFSMIGLEVRYDSILDAFDWVYPFIDKCGICTVHRTYIDGRVIIWPKKITLRTHLKKIGIAIYSFIALYGVIYIRAEPPLENDDLVLFIFYAIVPFFSTYLYYLGGDTLYEHIHVANLHAETDRDMRQLYLHMDYRLLMIPLFLCLTAVYSIMFIAIAIYIYAMFSIDFFSYFFELTAGLLSLCPLTYFLFLIISSYFMPVIRFTMIRFYLKQELSRYKYFDGKRNYLKVPRTPNTIMNVVTGIICKQYEFMNISLSSTSFLFLIILHVYTFLFASVIYVYLQDGIALYGFIFLIILATPMMVIIMVAAELCKYLRNSLLLQASHDLFEVKAGDILPIDNSLLLWFVDTILGLVIFLIQSK